ncbi:MAG: ATP-binding protein [Deltaproteobacteria bacterium]|nr:MAG: ATP-binding protein [Deltaproteobacteria bacterium]
MPFSHRLIESEILKAAKNFPSLIVTGPRRSGKTTLLQKLFPKAAYYLLEDPDLIGRIQMDPKGFLSTLKTPVILDEIQNIPEILNYVRTLIDRNPKKKGQWLFTGSQEHSMMRGVTESMAGRSAIFHLYPFSHSEVSKVSPFLGGYPEVVLKPSIRTLWFRSYLQTYLERDVRQITAVKDLATFRRFLSLLASRIGQVLNKSDLAAPLGVSVPTITEWLNILEMTSQILLIPPYFENFGKRLIKSPKIYWVDTGLACFLLNIDSIQELEKSPFLGALFESFVASEIVKNQVGTGKPRELYFFRDEQGLEVDFLAPLKGKKLALIEVKSGSTLNSSFVQPMKRLAQAIESKKESPQEVSQYLVYRPIGKEIHPYLSSSVKSLSYENLLKEIVEA